MNEIKVEGPTLITDEYGVALRMYSVNYIRTAMVCREVDEWLIKTIFIEREYALPLKGFSPKFILDCGGNVGMSALFFVNVFRSPETKIIVVEPDAENFRLLSINLDAYPNVECIRSALWDRETYIDLKGNAPAAYQTFETKSGNPRAIKSTTIAKLLAGSGFDEIDLLKVDIEGAEKEVFSAPDVHDWLSKVKVIAIELHDRYKRGCSRAVFKAIAEHDFNLALNGENLIFIRGDVMDQHYVRHADLKNV